MAITLTSNGVTKHGFSVNGNSADLSGCETLVDAVAGKSIYVENLSVSFGATVSVTIGEGETTGAVTTTRLGPVYGAENSTVSFGFKRPIKLTAATALTVDSSGAGNVTVIAEGFIA